MHIRSWQDGLRDFRADWRDWSQGERIAAGLLIAATAGAGLVFALTHL
jgi:hypothetical protein